MRHRIIIHQRLVVQSLLINSNLSGGRANSNRRIDLRFRGALCPQEGGKKKKKKSKNVGNPSRTQKGYKSERRHCPPDPRSPNTCKPCVHDVDSLQTHRQPFPFLRASRRTPRVHHRTTLTSGPRRTQHDTRTGDGPLGHAKDTGQTERPRC